jgi:diacylglycerol kinase family enzyme
VNIFVTNARSGSAMARAELGSLCKKYGIRIDEWLDIDDKEKLARYGKKGATVYVLGGDGTVSSVTAVLVGTKAVLVPLPGGTLNHFTKDVHVPQTLEEALAHSSKRGISTVDTAEVNGRVFINNASLGLYPSSLRTRSKFENYVGKWPAAVIAAWRAFVRLKTYTVTIDDETFQTPFVFVGNNVYELDTLGIPSRKRLDEEVLTVFIAKTTSRLALLRLGFLTLLGLARELQDFEVRHVRELRVATKRARVRVSYDGEVAVFVSPLRFKIRPKSIRTRV